MAGAAARVVRTAWARRSGRGVLPFASRDPRRIQGTAGPGTHEGPPDA